MTKEKSQPSILRVSKKPIDKPIGDRRPKQRIRVSRHPKSPSMSRKNKEAAEQRDEEQAQPEEPSSPGNSETQSLLSKIEILEKEIRELKEQLAEEKAEPRAPGLDTLAEAVDTGRRGEIQGTLCCEVGGSRIQSLCSRQHLEGDSN